MIRRTFLEKIAAKAGVTVEQVKLFLEAPDEDFADADANAALSAVMTADEAIGNDTVFGRAKGKAKAEALDPIDTMLKTYEPKLSPEQKAEYKKLGADSFKKYQYVLDAFDKSETPTGDKNYDELKTTFDALKGKLETDYVARGEYDSVKGSVSKAQEDTAYLRLLTGAIRNPRLRDVATDRHFERNFIEDAKTALTRGFKGTDGKLLKGVLDAATGLIMRADSPEQPLLLNGRSAGLSDLAEVVIADEEFGWGKKSNPAGVGEIVVPGGAGNPTMTEAQRRNLLDD